MRIPSRIRSAAMVAGCALIMGAGAATAAAPAHAAPAVASVQAVPFINFGDSCGSVSVDSRGVLHATCKRRDGSLNTTSLGLDQYVGNNNGFLQPNGSHFTETCIDVKGGVTLEARCKARNGTFDNATLNLNNHVDNTNGFLVWAG
jgi:hypothetical protein